MLNSPNEPSEEPITMLTQPVDLTPKEEIRPLFGYLKTADTRCLSATSTVFTITQDTEDHPTDIANCSESWARTLVPNTASSTIRGQRYCSSESHGLVTWQMCMGEFPELKGQMDTAKFTTDAENEKNATHGYWTTLVSAISPDLTKKKKHKKACKNPQKPKSAQTF